ncbi:MAG: ABC transporter transmembrane domain-containing protein [Pseudomonadota bacterium]
MNDEKKGNITSLKKMGFYLKPYRLQIFFAFIAIIFTSSVVLGLGGAIKYLIDKGINQKDTSLLDQAYFIFMALTAALAIATYIRYYLVSWVGEKVVADIRRDVFSHVIRLDIAFFETTKTGELLSRLTTDTTLLQNVVGSSVSVFLRNSIMFLGGCIMMFHTSKILTLYVSFIVPAVVFPILFIGRRVRGLSRATQDRIADLSAQAEETISGIRTIQAFSLESFESDKFSNHANSALKTALQRISFRALLIALVIGLVFGAVMTVLWFGAHDVMTGKLSSGELSAFIFYAVVAAGSLGAVSEVFGELQRAGGAAERLIELITTDTNIKEIANPLYLPEILEGRVKFDNVSFSYPSRPDKSSVTDLNLIIESGETIALVGPSGAGKSTIFQLILRFYDPQKGNIFIDDKNIRDLKIADLRSHIGIVPQDPVIFSANAWDNIKCGKKSATAKEIIDAAEAASALEFLEKLPEGLDSYLGEKGVRLSGGQKQRIAIARAMLRNPRILLLDEATSALDSENELKVQEALAKLMQNRTTIVIAHRLATILNADRIAVVNNSKIEAIGKHEELLKTSPLYARLAELQFRFNG